MDPAQQVELAALSRQELMSSAVELFSSRVQLFYRGAAVLVTGGSGFLGKQLIEKLFRSCQVKKVYVLLRPKNGKTVLERLEHMLKDPVFDSVRRKQAEYASRLVAVEGDAASIRLGISDQDWTALTDEVSVIFHMAATTRIDEPLRLATLTNVRGTKEVITLAQECKNLKKFVHVSTAYSHATFARTGGEVLEQFYPTPVQPDVLINLAETVEEARLNSVTANLMDGWPNTYTFSKAVAEELVRTAPELPACVIRPAIVLSTYTEPIPGWLDLSCAFGPSGIILGLLLGVLRAFFVDVHKRLPLVPVDYVTNTILSAAWDSVTRGTHAPVYTVANVGRGITWEFIAGFLRSDEFRRLGTPLAVWYCFLIETSSKMYFHLLTWMLHYIPAYFFDAVFTIVRIKLPKEVPSFIQVYEKISKFTLAYSYFTTNEFNFQDGYVKAMVDSMSPEDQAIFNCDLSTVDSKEFVRMWLIGVRKYILKDGLKGSEKAYKRQIYFQIAHYVIMLLYCYIFWIIVQLFWNVLSGL